MPRKPMDYSKTIMYKLVCNDLNIKECYVGHTTDFKSRKYNHKQSIENINHKDYNSKKSTFIREHGGFENWSMIQIEPYPCEKLQEAIARERYWYEELHATLNSHCPNRNTKEWRKVNKEQLQVKNKKYYEDNKDKLEEQRSTKYECDCGSTIRQDSKIKHLKSFKHCQFLETNNI